MTPLAAFAFARGLSALAALVGAESMDLIWGCTVYRRC